MEISRGATKWIVNTFLVLVLIAAVIYGILLYNHNQAESEKSGDVQTSEQSDKKASGNGSEALNGNRGSNTGVTRQSAGEIATNEFGGSVLNVEDDDYNDQPAWEVEIEDSNEGRIEVKVDKSTGEILAWETD